MHIACLTLIQFGQSKLQLIFGVWSSVSAHTSGLSYFCVCVYVCVSALGPNGKAFPSPFFLLARAYVKLRYVFKDRFLPANEWGSRCNALFCCAHPQKNAEHWFARTQCGKSRFPTQDEKNNNFFNTKKLSFLVYDCNSGGMETWSRKINSGPQTVNFLPIVNMIRDNIDRKKTMKQIQNLRILDVFWWGLTAK